MAIYIYGAGISYEITGRPVPKEPDAKGPRNRVIKWNLYHIVEKKDGKLYIQMIKTIARETNQEYLSYQTMIDNEFAFVKRMIAATKPGLDEYIWDGIIRFKQLKLADMQNIAKLISGDEISIFVVRDWIKDRI